MKIYQKILYALLRGVEELNDVHPNRKNARPPIIPRRAHKFVSLPGLGHGSQTSVEESIVQPGRGPGRFLHFFP